MSTTIEQLELEIQSNSKNAVSGIDALTESLGKLKGVTAGKLGLRAIVKELETFNSADVNGAKSKIDDLSSAILKLSDLPKSKLSSVVTPLKNLPKAFEGLKTMDMSAVATTMQGVVTALKPLETAGRTSISSTVTALKKLPEAFKNIDTRALYNKVQSLTRIFKPLADEMEKIAAGFSAMPSKIQKLIKETDKIPISNKNAATSFTDLYHKLKMTAIGFKAVGNSIYSLIRKSSEYNEVVNLFSTSLGKYAEAAYDAADTTDDIKGISELMGIDSAEWMKSQGIFMTLATGFGVAGDRANTMSKQLTQLGYDISSFQDISVEEAMQKLQSGLSGELEPLRRIGYDLSQAKLEATALALGIDKSVSSMTQAEKAQLRYYAIMEQVTQQHGDMAKTINEPANQMRIFKAQLSMTAREIGNVFIPALQVVLPYLTAITKVVGSLASIIAELAGYEAPVVEDKGIGTLASGAESASDSLDDATESAKKLKSYMLGFDELNVINPTEGSSSNIDDASSGFDFDLPTYNFMEKLTEQPIFTKITDEMKEWLGITEDITSWSDLLSTRFGNILIAVGLIGGSLAAWKIAEGVEKTISAISNLTKIGSFTLGVALVVTGITIGAFAIESALTDGLNTVNATTLFVASASVIAGGTLIGKAFGKMLIGAAISAIIVGVVGLGVGLYDAISNELNVTNGLVIAGSATLIGIAVASLLPHITIAGTTIGGTFAKALLGAAMGLVVGGAIAGAVWIVQNTEETIEKVGGIVSGALLAVGAILAFTGVNLPLGIGLMVAGAVSMGTSIALNTNALSDEVKGVIAVIGTAVSLALLEVGAILAFTGANIPLGIALMAGGALTMGTAVLPNWNELSDTIQTILSGVMTGLGGALLAIGAILAFSSANIPLGIGLMLVGAASLGTAIALNWNSIVTALRGPIGEMTTMISTALLVLGGVLLFTGAGIPLGLGLMLAGAAGLATVAVVNWDSITNTIRTVVSTILVILSGAMLALGALLLLSGAGVGLGLALIFGALVTGTAAWKVDDNPVTQFVRKMVNGVVNILNGAIDAINDMFHIEMDALVIGGITIIPAINKRLINIPHIPLLAEGGFPEQGQMFIAREAGAEMVGNIGRRTAVANNDQIVSGIAGGVAEANEEQNVLLREQNSLLRAILEKDSGAYLDGKNLTNSVEKYQRERGRVLITGGVL